MASKTIEEFLKSASKEHRGGLDKLSQHLKDQGIEERREPPPTQTQSSEALTQQADVQQINQDWQQGKDVKIEPVSEKSDLMLGRVNQTPKAGPHDYPQFMDEKKQGQQPLEAESAKGMQTSQQEGLPQGQYPQVAAQENQQPRNAVQEVQAADAKREMQPKAPEAQKSQSPAPSPQPER